MTKDQIEILERIKADSSKQKALDYLVKSFPELNEDYILCEVANYELDGFDYRNPVVHRYIAYIAGATESGVQWHKVADGDIPPDRHNVLSEKGEVVVMKDIRWYEYSPNYDNILQRSWEEPKYWCEIPKFEVEL